MRWFGLLLLSLIVTASAGQNYQPINSNSLQVFYQEPLFPLEGGWESPEESGGNMWGTRIDSIQVINTDTVFYNYLIYRDTASENGNYDCIWGNAPNWNGTQTKIEPSGSAWFYNQDNDSILIEFAGSIGTEWVAYNYPNGDSLVAQVSDVQWIDDGWLSDSVKTMTFHRYSNGMQIPDEFNEVEIQLYKTSGFRKMVDFSKFPMDTVQIHRVDLNFINQYSPGYDTDLGLRPAPLAGDGHYHIKDCWYYGAGEGSGYWLPQCNGPIHSSEYIHDVSAGSIPGQLNVTRTRNTSESPPLSVTETVTYDPLPDSLFTLIQKYDDGNLMPREEGAAYVYHLANLAGSGDTCQYPIVSVYDYGGYGEGPCISYYSYECSSGAKYFAPYIGLIGSWRYFDNGWCDGGVFFSTGFRYLKVGNITCGEYAMVGIEKTKTPTFTLYPNPANRTVAIRLSDSSASLGMTVTDMLGRPVTILDLDRATQELDVSSWSDGIYFITISNNDGLGHTEKLVVQH